MSEPKTKVYFEVTEDNKAQGIIQGELGEIASMLVSVMADNEQILKLFTFCLAAAYKKKNGDTLPSLDDLDL